MKLSLWVILGLNLALASASNHPNGGVEVEESESSETQNSGQSNPPNLSQNHGLDQSQFFPSGIIQPQLEPPQIKPEESDAANEKDGMHGEQESVHDEHSEPDGVPVSDNIEGSEHGAFDLPPKIESDDKSNAEGQAGDLLLEKIEKEVSSEKHEENQEVQEFLEPNKAKVESEHLGTNMTGSQKLQEEFKPLDDHLQNLQIESLGKQQPTGPGKDIEKEPENVAQKPLSVSIEDGGEGNQDNAEIKSEDPELGGEQDLHKSVGDEHGESFDPLDHFAGNLQGSGLVPENSPVNFDEQKKLQPSGGLESEMLDAQMASADSQSNPLNAKKSFSRNEKALMPNIVLDPLTTTRSEQENPADKVSQAGGVNDIRREIKSIESSSDVYRVFNLLKFEYESGNLSGEDTKKYGESILAEYGKLLDSTESDQANEVDKLTVETNESAEKNASLLDTNADAKSSMFINTRRKIPIQEAKMMIGPRIPPKPKQTKHQNNNLPGAFKKRNELNQWLATIPAELVDRSSIDATTKPQKKKSKGKLGKVTAIFVTILVGIVTMCYSSGMCVEFRLEQFLEQCQLGELGRYFEDFTLQSRHITSADGQENPQNIHCPKPGELFDIEIIDVQKIGYFECDVDVGCLFKEEEIRETASENAKEGDLKDLSLDEEADQQLTREWEEKLKIE